MSRGGNEQTNGSFDVQAEVGAADDEAADELAGAELDGTIDDEAADDEAREDEAALDEGAAELDDAAAPDVEFEALNSTPSIRWTTPSACVSCIIGLPTHCRAAGWA